MADKGYHSRDVLKNFDDSPWAEAMNLWMFEVKDADLAAIAKRLPTGRLHGSGRGLVPFIKGDLYAELVSETVGDQEVPIAPGHLVIAHETHELGWCEAIVLKRNGDLLTLKYRDYPKYSKFVRHRSAVALIAAPAP